MAKSNIKNEIERLAGLEREYAADHITTRIVDSSWKIINIRVNVSKKAFNRISSIDVLAEDIAKALTKIDWQSYVGQDGDPDTDWYEVFLHSSNIDIDIAK